MERMFVIAIVTDKETTIYKVIATNAPVLKATSEDLNRLLFQLSIEIVANNELFLLKIFFSVVYFS